jgi:hypothetical protein
MLEHNPDWEGRAEIIAISLDDDKESPQGRIQDRGWTKISSYWGGEGDFGARVPAMFKIEGIPTCLLVKKGKILWRGHPSHRKLEADIQHLITNDSLPVEIAQPSFVLPEEEKQAALEKARTQVRNLKGITPPYFFYLERESLTSEGIEKTSKSSLCGSFLGKFRPDVEAAFQALKEAFPNVVSKCTFVKVLPAIHRGDNCKLCNRVLSPTDIQYMCVHCEPAHYHCQACEDLPREGQGSAKLAHPHSLYIITPEADHLDELIIGSNLPMDPDLNQDLEDKQHRMCGCDNGSVCGGPVIGVRYHCAQCPTFDLCEGCEAGLRGDMPEDQKKGLTSRGHRLSHVLVKIPFPLEEYGYASNEDS